MLAPCASDWLTRKWRQPSGTFLHAIARAAGGAAAPVQFVSSLPRLERVNGSGAAPGFLPAGASCLLVMLP